MSIHFISGLPRSGSTLLCAVLRQNPRFQASVTSPIASLYNALLPRMSGGSEFSAFFDNDRRRRILKAVFDGYYGEETSGQVIFDTNRTWTSKMSLLQAVFQGSRLICCVREVGWIIDSLERMLRANPLQTSRIFDFKPGSTIYARVETLMDSDKGLIGLAWSSLREAWFSEYSGQLLIIRYESLARDPIATISKLYEALEQPIFDHNFENIVYDEPGFDADLGMPGLHKVRRRVEFLERPARIPPDLFAKYADTSFWLRPELNRRGITII